MADWIPTQWQMRIPLGDDADVIVVDRMESPFYADVRYAVRRRGRCLNTKGVWEWEPIPSARNMRFYTRCRFTSLSLAQWAAEKAIKE